MKTLKKTEEAAIVRKLPPPDHIQAFTIRNSRDFVNQWLIYRKLDVRFDGSFFDEKGRRIDATQDQIFGTLWLDATEWMEEFNAQVQPKLRISMPKESDMRKAFDEYILFYQIRAKSAKIEELRYDNKLDDTELIKYAHANFIKVLPHHIAILKHFIWQVKRKLNGLEVHSHMMPIWFGKTGGGKSFSVAKFVSPLEEFKNDNSSILEVIDPRNSASMTKQYAIVLDELAKADKIDIESLKQLITKSSFSSRDLYSKYQSVKKQNSTFIGTTNKSVEELIVDTTGMRRFYQFNSKDLLDWDVINSLNYLKIWKSVNEFNDVGYIKEYHKIINADQAEWTAKDNVQLYLDEKGYQSSENGKFIPTNEIFESYVKWCQTQLLRPFSGPAFGRRLVSLGYISKRERLGGSNRRGFLIQKSGDESPDEDSPF